MWVIAAQQPCADISLAGPEGETMGTEVVALLQIAAFALLAWGAYLCFAGRDRRKGTNRRRESRDGPRGGRRLSDGVRLSRATGIAPGAASQDESAERNQAARVHAI